MNEYLKVFKTSCIKEVRKYFGKSDNGTTHIKI